MALSHAITAQGKQKIGASGLQIDNFLNKMPRDTSELGNVVSRQSHSIGASDGAFYRDVEAAISISTGEILAGDIARRAHKLLVEWAHLRHAELADNWRRATSGESLLPVDPLD